jgi:hypothetical protein
MNTPNMTVPESEIRAAIDRIDALKREKAELRSALKSLLEHHCRTLRCENLHPCPENISTLQPYFELIR